MNHDHSHDDTDFDPWSMDSGVTYEPHKFYTRASDDKGHNQEVRVHMPPSLYARAQFVAGGGTAWGDRYKGSVAALLRDALLHRITFLVDQTPEGSRLSEDVIRQIRIEVDMAWSAAQAEQIDQQRHLVDAWRSLLDLSYQSGDKRHLAATVMSMKMMAAEYDDPLKSQLLSLVVRFDQ